MALMDSNPLRLSALTLAVVLSLAACGKKDSAEQAQQGQQGAAQQAPAPVVGVVTVQPQEVELNVDLPARLEAVRSADVRAQVGGIVQRRLFQEGSFVRQGQPLYQIDSSTYSAAVESARAQLASAEAALAKANADLARYRPLVAADAVSKQEFDAVVQAKRAGEASVKAGRAAVKSAQINLNRSQIVAPISGFIGQSHVSEGTLLSAGDPTVLASIRQTDLLYVNVTQSAGELIQLRKDIASGKLQANDGAVEVTIYLENGEEYEYKGRLMFADPTVDEATGQVSLRAGVPNPDNILLPGLYVRVSMPQGVVSNAFVVPQQAVTRGQQDTVLIVNAQGGIEPRVVTIAKQQGANWIVTGGLQAGDKVIVEGISIAGMIGAKVVTPKEWTPPAQQGAMSTATQQNDKDDMPSEKEEVSAEDQSSQEDVQMASEEVASQAASEAR